MPTDHKQLAPAPIGAGHLLKHMAASPAVSEQPLPAKTLIDFLAAPAAAPVYKAKGMVPG